MRYGRELALVLVLLGAPSARAADALAVDVINASEPTLCAEKDNVYLKLQSGEAATMDEAYVRDSILNPGSKVVDGFQPIMPTFQGQVSEEALLGLIEYVKSLKSPEQIDAARPATGTATPGEAGHTPAPEARN